MTDDTTSTTIDPRLDDRGTGELAEKMGMVITELSAERAVGSIPVEGNRQPVGLLHGGAYVVLAESLGAMVVEGRPGGR